MNIMKNSSYVINAIVALAIVVPSILFFSSCNNADGSATASGIGAASNTEGFSGATLPIAYLNIDSLLVNYDYAKDVNERLTKKMEDIRVQINQKTKKLEKDMGEFQRKAQNNAFLSEERAQQEYNRLQKQDQDLQQTAQRLQNEWAMEQQKENMQIADSVRTAVKIQNEISKYELVLNMRELDNIILANPKYDITEDILTLLNSRYKPTAKK